MNMYVNFLSTSWLIAVQSLLVDIRNDGQLKRVYQNERRFVGLNTLHLESLIDIIEYSFSEEELLRLRSKHLMAVTGPNSLVGSSQKNKNVNTLLKRINKGKNTFTPIEKDYYVQSLGSYIIQSFTINLSLNQKMNLEKKLDDYLEAFINNKLIESGRFVVSFENHKDAFIRLVKTLLSTQSMDNILVDEKPFLVDGWHFWEMVFSLEKIGFIQIIELGDDSFRSRLFVSSNEARKGNKYVRFKLLDKFKSYDQKDLVDTKIQSEVKNQDKEENVNKESASREIFVGQSNCKEDLKSEDYIFYRDLTVDLVKNRIYKGKDSINNSYPFDDSNIRRLWVSLAKKPGDFVDLNGIFNFVRAPSVWSGSKDQIANLNDDKKHLVRKIAMLGYDAKTIRSWFIRKGSGLGQSWALAA
jgi:hypothetical protein